MTLTGFWVLCAFVGGCVHIARSFDHPDLGSYVLAGAAGLLAFATLLVAGQQNGTRRRHLPSGADAVF